MLARFIALLVVLVAASSAFAGPDSGWQGYPGLYDIRALGVKCDRSEDATTKLRNALEPGGTLAGKRVFLPSGCQVLLGTPGAGDKSVDLASGTTLFCEDTSAGFFLARRYCSGGDTPGGACDASADCPGGGTCVYDTGSSEFAPTGGSIYTVIGGASGTYGQRVENCTIWGNQRSAYLTSQGNSINTMYRYCSGGTKDTAVCNQRCVGGSIPGAACNADGECAGGGTCGNVSQCSSGGGTCREWLYTQPGGPAGPGNIRAVDFDGNGSAQIINVTANNIRTSDYVFRLGNSGYAERVTNISFDLDSDTIYWFLGAGGAYPAPDVGMSVASGSTTMAASMAGWRAAYRMQGGSSGTTVGATILSSTAAGFGAVGGTGTDATYPGTIGWMTTGAGNYVGFSRAIGGILLCFAPEYNSDGQNAQHFIQNHCDWTPGPLATIFSAHNDVRNNRKAWGGYGSGLSFGEERGRCTAGTRSGKLCFQHAGTDATWGCPSSACAAHADFKGSGGGHFQVTGNFIHSDQTAFSGLTIDQSKRCLGGVNVGKPCTVAGDCTGSSCASLSFPIGQIDDNIFYNQLGGASSVAVDLSSPALDTAGGLSGVSISNNSISLNSGGTALKFPGTAGQAAQLRVEGNSITDTITNYSSQWTEEFGLIDAQSRGLNASDVNFRGKNLVNRTASLPLYSVVEPDTANVDSVKQAVAGTRNAIGCGQFTTPASGTTISVATEGVATCLVDADNGGTGGSGVDPNVAIGDPLTMHPGAAGKLVKATNADRVFGYAQQSASTDTSIRVLLKHRDAATDEDRTIADLPAGNCIAGTGYSAWDIPTSNAAGAACLGSTYARGVLTFSDGGGAGATLSAYTSVVLPNPWSGALYADIWWGNSTTSGNVVWQMSGVCVANDDGEDPAFSSTANTVTGAADVTNANDVVKSTITFSAASNNPLNTCAAGETMHLRLFRDPTNGSDTTTSSVANVYRVVLRQ